MPIARIALVVALAVAAVTALTPTGAAQVPEPQDPQTVLPAVPREVGDRLPAPGDLQQRHPWQPNDAPWPWNMSIAQGSWTNSNGSVTLVHCGPTVASDNPYWYQENMLYTRWTGGARCNVEMRAITGTSRLYQHNGAAGAGALLGEAAIGAQQVVPPNHGSGWQAFSEAYYSRTSAAQFLQIHLRVTLEIQPWGTGARWNTVPNSCTRDANIRIIHCELWSIPFQHAPYSCPTPERIGTQPGRCVGANELDDIEENNDNVADGAFPDGTPPPQPDPEVEADYAVCGDGDDQSSCLDSGPTTPETQEAACAPTCDAFFVGAATQPEDIPEWVRDLQVFRDFQAAGLDRNVMFYESEAAVASGTGPTSCPRRYVCLYTHAQFRGGMFATNVNGSHYNLDDYGFRNRISSWSNKKTAHDALMSSFEAGNRCLPRRHYSSFVGRFNDKADELDVFGSTVRCNIG